MNKVEIEIQYFSGCPNSDKIIANVKEALKQIDFEYDYSEILVETNEKADQLNFRGSPTLLVNGMDFESLPETMKSSLSCRFYKNGIPSTEEIALFIKQNIEL